MIAPPLNDRDLDVVVFGATSVTGRLVAAYLTERAAATGSRWGAAARDAGRLSGVLAEVGGNPDETIIAELGDPASLAAMAARSRVVVNLVGPYAQRGRPVVEACVAGGAHYVDLSGEMPFVRRTIDAFNEAAFSAGVKVVQPCGFEALPPDLAVLLAAETAAERYGAGLEEVDLELSVRPPPRVPRPSDFLSGGTLQTIAAIMVDRDASKAADPGCLITDSGRAEAVRRRSPIAVAPRRGERGQVIAPMAPAAFINPAVIHRTAALVAAESGAAAPPFRYREGIALAGGPPTLPLRLAAAGAMSATQGGLTRLASTAPALRRRIGTAMERILPSSGYGPSPDRVEGWSWRMSVRARAAGGGRVSVDVDADGHPGYLSTARMMGEAGLLLAASGATPERSGCLTPAAALGTGALDRFESARMRFSVRD
jgi:short subunit dehydrogenase-like uncharacterized protein